MTLNAVLDSIQAGLSKYGRSKQSKIDKIESLGVNPDKDDLIQILTDAYTNHVDIIKELRNQKKEYEDILQEYEPCDFHTVNKVTYYFDYDTQTLWSDREKTTKCGKYHRDTGTYTMI